MNKLITTLLILTIFTTLITQKGKSHCDELYDTSKIIMQARLDGVDIETLISSFIAQGKNNYEILVIEAYKRELYISEVNEVISASIYAEMMYNECITITEGE